MTVSYTAEVARSSYFGCFSKLLLRWRASIYKLIWLDLLVYIGIYYAINFSYRFLLNAEQKEMFKVFVEFCINSSALIPLMFVLGFYVSIVIKRWWEQYMTLPWPDSTAVYVSSLIRGHDENGRKMRRTIMRYVCLSLTMVLTIIAPRVRKRFPTLGHLVDAGLLNENEKIILSNMDEKFSKHPKHWMPIVWAAGIVTRARKEGRIRDDFSLKTLIDSLNSFRGMCMVLLFYDTISIPLVYTQVVTIAVYSYLLTSIFGRQWTGEIDEKGNFNIIDYFFPFFTLLEYLFFMGWLKVAESLISPFGEDDDDFEVNWLIDRNLQVSYLIVDEMHNEHPELIKDQYWDRIFPIHTRRSTSEIFEKKSTIKETIIRFLSKNSVRDQADSKSANNNNFESKYWQGSFSIFPDIPSILSTESVKNIKNSHSTRKTSDSSAENEKNDDFEKLKRKRQQERLERFASYTLKPTTENFELLSCTSRVSQSAQNDILAKSSSSKSSAAVQSITYTAEVATCLKFGCFVKLLARWRGSIYKLIWMDLVLFLVLYYLIHVIYYYLISENNYKETFESIVAYCSSYLSLIPLSFVLGFYVNLVMSRWWDQYITIPWPDSAAVFVSACVHGQDEGGRLMRRTIMRYVCLCLTIVFTMISPGVKKRFPKMKHLVEAGLLLENERQIFEKLDNAFPKYPKHWMPIIWAASIITRARKEGRIRDDFAVKTIIDELNDFRGRCGSLLYYDFISIPLVYTQVVTIAVYSFFLCSLLAHQWTEKKHKTYEELDYYYPIFITLQFFFYMGWLKVAETLINPFGEDDDDFEVNWMIDRNLQISYLIVDEMHHEHPELLRDQYWDEVYPSELPYISEAKKEKHPESSTAKYDLLDSPRSIGTRLSSKANLLIMNGKLGSTISTSRSQRFNEAFQRLFSYSQAGSRSDVENSFQSDIEDIEQITSYSFSGEPEPEPKTEDKSVGEMPILEPIIEESESYFEEMYEEDMTKEEDDKIESVSSHENGSDSDPFERLRIERQSQRLQRMNDFLKRYFGSNFLVQLQYVPKCKFRPGEQSAQDRSEHLSHEFEVNFDKSIDEIQSDKSLLIPKASVDISALNKEHNNGDKAISEPISLKPSRVFTIPEINSNTEIQQQIMESLSGITLKTNTIAADITTSGEEQESQAGFSPEASNINISDAKLVERLENILANTSVSSFERKVSISTQTQRTSKLLDLNSMTSSNADVQLSVPTSTEEVCSTAQALNRTLVSKGTSPFGSPVSLSPQSSFADGDISNSNIQSADEHKTEQDKSEEPNSSG